MGRCVKACDHPAAADLCYELEDAAGEYAGQLV
jgi:hypothetical protein